MRSVAVAGVSACLAAGAWAPRARAEYALAGDLALTASAGQLGSDALYVLRLAYFASRRVGLEATLAHNPSGDVHAALHAVNAVAPLGHLGPVRPFATAGLGTIHVFPGTALNARSVTKLLVNAGGGVRLHLRDDVALRLEARSITVLDQQETHRGAYHYAEWSAGLVFTRPLHRPVISETGASP